MINLNELKVGSRVVLSGKTAPRLILEVWKEGKDVLVSLKGTNGVTHEVVNANRINRVIAVQEEFISNSHGGHARA